MSSGYSCARARRCDRARSFGGSPQEAANAEGASAAELAEGFRAFDSAAGDGAGRGRSSAEGEGSGGAAGASAEEALRDVATPLLIDLNFADQVFRRTLLSTCPRKCLNHSYLNTAKGQVGTFKDFIFDKIGSVPEECGHT